MVSPNYVRRWVLPPIDRVLTELPVQRGRWWSGCLGFIALFLCWPKYLSVDIGPARLSPTNLLIFGLGIALVAIWSIRASQGERVTSVGRIILAGFILIWLLRFFSDLSAPDYVRALFLTLRDFIWTAFPFLIVFRLAGGREGITGVTKVLIASCLFLAIVGIAERLSGVSAANWIFAHLPISVPDDYANMLLRDKTRDGSFRIQSVMAHPLLAGEVFSALIPVCMAGVVLFRRTWRSISTGALLLAVCALIFTGSRSSLIAAAAGAGFYSFASVARSANIWMRVFGTAAMGVGMLVGVPLAMATVAELRAGQTAAEIQSSGWRDQMWALGTPAISQQPYFGHGDGQSLEIAGIKVGSGLTVDDYYLTQLLDFGYVNLFIFLSFISLVILVGAFAGPRSPEGVAFAALAGGVIAILVGQKATSIFEGMGVLYLFAGIISSATVSGTIFARRIEAAV